MAYQFSNREYTNMLRAYFISGESLRGGVRMYRELYPNARQPDMSTMLNAYYMLLEHGQFRAPTHAQGRGRTGYSQDVVDDVLDFFAADPRRSTREAARRFGLSQYCAWKIINSSGQHPFHFRKVQELTSIDCEPRLQLCRWILDHPNVNILFSDESMFTRIGIFNSHNEHWWAYRNPNLAREHSFQHRFSVNVWAGILNNCLIGPFFIEGRLTGLDYLNLLRRMLEDMTDRVPLANLRDLYFQHDGAPPHYHREVRAYLDQEFGERWIGRGGPIAWPARSPDLTPLDFFLWSEIKRRVYHSEPRSERDLKRRIRKAFREVRGQEEVLLSLKNNLLKRARLCIQNNGGHFERLLQYV